MATVPAITSPFTYRSAPMPSDQPADSISQVRSAYDRWSSHYDTDHNRTRDLDAQIFRTHGPSVRGRAVLELGCGTGKNTELLAATCREVTALDISAGMLAIARERITASHVQFVEQDISAPWPVPSATIDLVVSNLVLEHVQDLRPVYAEAARVLRKGGKLYLSELHPMRQLRGTQARFTDTESGDVVHVPAFHHSVSEFVNTALASGFTLRALGEWLEDDAVPGAPPRILTVYLVRSAS